jgi:hemolysin activation/secretion protein
MHYQVVQGIAGVAGAVGKAITQGVELAYPLIRSTNTSSTVSLTQDYKHFDNVSAQGLDLSNYKTQVSAAQISGLKRDMVGADSLVTYSATASRGTVDLDGSLSQAADIVGPNTEGNFAKLKLNTTITEPITSSISLFGSLTAQRSSKNLDTSEKMQLGGESGVRAYPTGEGSGSEGEMINLEFRQSVSENVHYSLFYDIGRIYQMKDANYPGGPQNNAYLLRGYGIGLGYAASNGMQFKLTWATRQGDNPNPTQTGMDQDGTYDRNRYWVQFSMPFQ